MFGQKKKITSSPSSSGGSSFKSLVSQIPSIGEEEEEVPMNVRKDALEVVEEFASCACFG